MLPNLMLANLMLANPMAGEEPRMPEADTVPEGVDPARPSPARLYDYYLGGTHNYEADRQAAEQLRQRMPELADAAWANRGFHGRAAIWMAEQGIRQFIDIGCGLPAPSNTHEAVRKVTPDARVVYVDHDPMVAAGRAPLLAPDGRTAFVAADLRDPDSVLGHPELRRLIDVREPGRGADDGRPALRGGRLGPARAGGPVHDGHGAG